MNSRRPRGQTRHVIRLGGGSVAEAGRTRRPGGCSLTEIFATGLRMGESPRWQDGRLWVCDWVAGQVLSFDSSGVPRVELRVPGLPFSVDWLPDGRTVLTCTDGAVPADATGNLA